MQGSANKQISDKELDMEQLLQKFTEDISNQLDNFRKDFKEFRTETNQAFSEFRQEIKEVKCELKDTRERMEEVKERIAQCEKREDVLHETNKFLMTKLKKAASKIDYLENKSRQTKFRIYNVKGGAEGGDMIRFVEDFLKEEVELQVQQKKSPERTAQLQASVQNTETDHA